MGLKTGRWSLVLLLFLVGAALGGFFWWQWAGLPPAPNFKTSSAKQAIFVIRKGDGLDLIASRLKEAGLVRSAFAFKLQVLLNGLSAEIQAGDFRLDPGMSLEVVASQLTHGTLDVWVTLLEGWRSEQIAQKLIDEAFNINIENWQSEIKNSQLEGYLFPDTYLFPKDVTQAAMIKILRNNFDKKIDSQLKRKMAEKDLTLRQVIILASIVEREAQAAKDRPVVAGILIKRWQAKWPLQADASVQYAIASASCRLPAARCDWWPQKLTKQDLAIDSPYNTYKYKGLPLGPIGNPGLASIEAVVDYQETAYWFYLSDSQGRMHYAQSIEEHNANIARYLK